VLGLLDRAAFDRDAKTGCGPFASFTMMSIALWNPTRGPGIPDGQPVVGLRNVP
jgi:hypothetical protein